MDALSDIDITQISSRMGEPIYVSKPFELLKSFKDNPDRFGDIKKTVYIKIKNPTLEEYLNRFEPDDEITKEDYEYRFENREYSHHLIGYIKTGFGGTYLFIDYNGVAIAYDPRKEPSHIFEESKLEEILAKIEKEAEKQAELIKKGLYKKETLDTMPFSARTGKILRNDLWHAYKNLPYSEPFAEFDEEFTIPEDKNKFLQLADTGETAEPGPRLKEMTSGIFFKALYAGYPRSGHPVKNMTPKEAYDHYADGRDEGLKKLDENDAKQFEEWLQNRNRSGHPWEILRGGNSTHVSVFILKDQQGYYFGVDGRSDGRFVESIEMYLAIKEAGYPVMIRDGQLMKEKLRGEDYIGIVPDGVIPRYCYSFFPNEDIKTFMNFYEYEDYAKRALQKVIWHEEKIPELKEGI